MAGRYRFLTSLGKVECRFLTDDLQLVSFLAGAPRATVSSEEPFCAPGIHSFEVHMKDKQVKTAVGFLSERNTTEYMRDKPIGEKFVSMGGAGFIHPMETVATKKYGQGDRVKVEVDFGQSLVNFYVNSEFVGKASWEGNKAFPAISCDGGPCGLEVTFPS